MTRSQFKKVLARYPGVTWDEEMEESGILQLDAPKGKKFAANDCHTMVEQFENITESWKAQAYSEMAERLSYGTGLIDCNEEDCEVCEE